MLSEQENMILLEKFENWYDTKVPLSLFLFQKDIYKSLSLARSNIT